MPWVDGRLIGKYRRLLVPFAALPRESAMLSGELQALRRRHDAGEVGDAELAAGFIRIFAGHRTQSTWPRIPGLPGMIPEILDRYLAGDVSLRLSAYPVSATEMLRAQAEGWRYVTLSFEHACAGTALKGTRDAFEFALHDLGHAYAFFKADYNPAGQVAFFRDLQSDLATLAPFARADAKFAHDLEYCMADMNSHPEHLRQYLKGVIVELFLRRQGAYEAELGALLKSLCCLRETPGGPSPAPRLAVGAA